MEDYNNRFLWLCAIIPQQFDNIYFRETFKEGLQTKVKMHIINMPRKKLEKVTKFAITMEEELP